MKEYQVLIRTIFYCLLITAASQPIQTVNAGEAAADADKLAVIELIEDHLAKAYTFRSAHESPDFGTLDRIFPEWHRGDPAGARRALDAYTYFVVSYHVYSVHITQPGMMTVKGEKNISSARKTKTLKLIPRTKTKKNTIAITIVCRRNEDGDWEIASETEG